MILPKAIELLRLDLANPGSVAIEDLNEAQELGIEALKRCQYIAEHTSRWDNVLLPGETK